MRTSLLAVLGLALIAIFVVNFGVAAAVGSALDAYRVDVPPDLSPISVDNSSTTSPGQQLDLGSIEVGPLPPYTGGDTARAGKHWIDECEALAVDKNGNKPITDPTTGILMSGQNLADFLTPQPAMEKCYEKYAYTVTRHIGSVWVKVTFRMPSMAKIVTSLSPNVAASGRAEYLYNPMGAFGYMDVSTSWGSNYPAVPAGIRAGVTPESFWGLVIADTQSYAQDVVYWHQYKVWWYYCDSKGWKGQGCIVTLTKAPGVQEGVAAPKTSDDMPAYLSRDSPDPWAGGVTEEMQKSIDTWGNLWTRDKALASCGGYWFGYAARYGCYYIHTKYRTEILTLNALPRAPAGSGKGHAEASSLTYDTSVLMSVDTDPFGVADDITMTSLPVAGGCGKQQTTFPDNWVWDCTTYEKTLGVGFNVPGHVKETSVTYRGVIVKFSIAELGGEAGTQISTMLNWDAVEAKMKALPTWVERLAFSDYITQHQGNCDTTCLSEFAIGPNVKWGHSVFGGLAGTEIGGFLYTAHLRSPLGPGAGGLAINLPAAYAAMLQASGGMRDRSIAAYGWQHVGDLGPATWSHQSPWSSLIHLPGCASDSWVCISPIPAFGTVPAGTGIVLDTPGGEYGVDKGGLMRKEAAREAAEALAKTKATGSGPYEFLGLTVWTPPEGISYGTLGSQYCRFATYHNADGGYSVEVNCTPVLMNMLQLVEEPTYIVSSGVYGIQSALLSTPIVGTMYVGDGWFVELALGIALTVVSLFLFIRRKLTERKEKEL